MKPFLIIITALLVYVGLEQLIELKTHGFWVERIQARDLGDAHPSDPPSQEVLSQLTQPYTLIGAGSECFAFLSADGQTVIKFFKLDSFRPVYLHRGLLCEDYSAYAGSLVRHEWSLKALPAWCQHLVRRLWGIREYRIGRTFQSIALSYAALREETALLYLHLSASTYFERPLTLYDACGIAHCIDLNHTCFVVQRRATPFEAHFAQLTEEAGKKSLDSLLALLTRRCQLGVHDRDIVGRNFGFIGVRAVEIDTGSFSLDARMKEAWLNQQELFYAMLALKHELEDLQPELALYLEEKIAGTL